MNVSYAAYWTNQSAAPSFVAGVYFFVTYTAGFIGTSVTDSPDGDEITSWTYAGLVCLLLFTAGVAVLRSVVHNTYRIPGSPFADCCVAFFCSCCAAAQLSGHTELSKKRRDTASTLPGCSRV